MNSKLEEIKKIIVTKPLKLDCGKTINNFPLAYGVYIFHVDAPGIGEKLGRFAVIK